MTRAALLIPGKAKIAELPLKDPNEMLLARKTKELVNAIWQARECRPDGIVTIADLRDQLNKPVEWGLPWPWETLTNATYGRRYGEVYTFGAGTGVGKTDIVTAIVTQTAYDLQQPCGLFFLEQSPTETLRRVAGKMAGKLFHIPDAG